MADVPATPVSTLPDDRFRALVEDLPAITYIADFVGTFTLRYVSPQIESVLGFSPDEWLADEEAWVRALHPDDRERIVAEAEACIAAERPFDFEYRMLDAAGNVRWFWEKTAIVRDADGRPVSVNGVMLDVTELKSTQSALLHEAERRVAERARFEAALRRQADEHLHRALHDELTGLPNRRHLFERLAAEIADAPPGGHGFSLLLLDLDRFKEVNDVLGHHSGDDLLRLVAQRFAATVRGEDLLARLGGDEFVALCPEVTNATSAERIAKRILTAIEQPFEIGEDRLKVSGSVGIALTEERCTRPDEVLRDADAAMYRAKRLQLGHAFFEAQADTPARLKAQPPGAAAP